MPSQGHFLSTPQRLASNGRRSIDANLRKINLLF
jgi:hypothetical protein